MANEQNGMDLRMVIVGKTGNGKSATGNTILGQPCFESTFSPTSLTVDCSKAVAVVDGQHVAVIDTPGVFDTRFGIDKTAQAICQCISYASPGPHIFLIVIRLGRYTDEEKQTVQKIQEIFGQEADRYSMVLLTGGDLLEGEDTIENFLDGSSDMQELVARCNGQYHVFNNKLKDRSQVTELLEKIRRIVKKNGGSHFTNEMFQEAKRAIEEEKQFILREKEEQIQKEREEQGRKIQEKYEKEMKRIQEKIQAERERERRQREEQRSREREMMMWRREMEIAEREAERKREDQQRALMIENMRKHAEEQHRRELEEERERLRQLAQHHARRHDDCTIL